ncbi:MAG: N-6 DNA methylase [Nanoarchaeota archaeon]|nr:N-6 DNA methylase [Nanoarchaeota archaeon]MBU0963325.1 N-6 DNA methylase [Nanoarchaeota archaeon]
MKNYLFILGRDPELSLLELECYFESRNIEYKILDYSKQVALVSLDNIKNLIKELAGIIKIAEVFSSTENLSEIEYHFNNLNLNYNKKVFYSISGYSTTLSDYVREILKDKFKKERIKGILKKPKRRTDEFLTPTELLDRDLINNGIDVVIFKNNIARTVAVFNPEEYKKRDSERPKKDFLKSISIRLAKILINLSYAKNNDTLLDPFCGTGTVLQEALLKKINVIGVDLDKNSVNDSIKNMDWLRIEYNIRNTYKIYHGDSRFLNKIIKNRVDAIVSEPYMGPFLKKEPTTKEAMNIINELKSIYTRFFEDAYNVISKKGKIAIIMPEIAGISIDPLRLTNKFEIYKPRINIKMPIQYMLKNSKIRRYIYVLEPK